MPVEFLTDEQAAGYGRFNDPPSRTGLERYFFLDDSDRELVSRAAMTAAAWGSRCSW